MTACYMDRFVDELIEDCLYTMSHTRTRLGDALLKDRQGRQGQGKGSMYHAKALYHGTRRRWARGIQVMPKKTPAVCERSSYCRTAGGSLGHGQYFSSSLDSAREWAQGPESDRAGPATPLYILKLDLGSICKDGTPVANLVGMRFPEALYFGCHSCPRAVQNRWRSKINDVLVQADKGSQAIDFVFLGRKAARVQEIEVVFTGHGLSRGLPITASELRRA